VNHPGQAHPRFTPKSNAASLVVRGMMSASRFKLNRKREGEDEAAHHEPFSGNATPQRFLRS
jgi:hypothetical protein